MTRQRPARGFSRATSFAAVLAALTHDQRAVLAALSHGHLLTAGWAGDAPSWQLPAPAVGADAAEGLVALSLIAVGRPVPGRPGRYFADLTGGGLLAAGTLPVSPLDD